MKKRTNSTPKANTPQRTKVISQLLGAVFICFLLVFLVFPTLSYAQVVKPFTQRTSQYSPTQPIYHIQGDFQMLGNTNLTLSSYGDNKNNEGNSMEYVDIDGISSTINSSSAQLKFSTEKGANPECTNVIYAGLYWMGKNNTGNMTSVISGTQTNATNSNTYNGYRLTIAKSGSTSINNMSSSVVTYRFHPTNVTGTGSDVVFTFSGGNAGASASGTSGYNVFKNSTDNADVLTVKVGNGPEQNLSCTTTANVAGFLIYYSYYATATLTEPYEINTGNSTITITSLGKQTWITIGDNDINNTYDYASIEYGNVHHLSKNQVKLKYGNEAYETISATTSDVYYPNGSYDDIFVGYAEVTDYVKAHGEGDYYVADICLTEGSNSNPGLSGGWGMIVVYENSKMKWRDITIFDGYTYISRYGSTTCLRADVPFSGFKAVQVGNVHTKVGFMAAEGDVNSNGDQMLILNRANNYEEILNPRTKASNNFFNSSIVNGGGSRSPNYQNNTGVDIYMFELDNSNNHIITNEQTSTTLRFSTTYETYTPFFLALGIDAYIPDAQAIDAVMETDAAVYDPALDIWVTQPGDTVTFTITVKNFDEEDVRDATIRLPLPSTIEFYELEAEYADGTTGDFYFNAIEGLNGTAYWGIDYLPAGYPDSVWATFKLTCVVTRNCYVLAASAAECLLEIVVNGTMSGYGTIENVYFEHDFIQGFQQSGVCQGAAITEDLKVVIDRDAYVREHCDCGNDLSPYDCHNTRELWFCTAANTQSIPFAEIAQYYPPGTRFFSSSNPDVEYTVQTNFPNNSFNTSIVASPPTVGDCDSRFIIRLTQESFDPEDPTYAEDTIIYCLDAEADRLSELVTINETADGEHVIFFKEHPGEDPANTDAVGFVDIIPPTDVPGTYTYWGVQFTTTPGQECYASEPQAITVIVRSAVEFTSSQTSPSCQGSAVTFTPDVTGGTYTIPDSLQEYFSINNTTSVATLLATAPGGVYSFEYEAPTGTDDHGCPASLTQTIEYELYPNTVPGSIEPATVLICQGGLIPDLVLTDYTGRVRYWEYRKGNTGAWTQIANSTSTVSQDDIAELTEGTYYFRALVRSGDCDSAYSAQATVTVSNEAAPTAPATQPIVFACVGDEFTLNPSGSQYRWYTSGTGGEADADLRSGTMTSQWVQRYVSVVNNSGCESSRTLVEARPYFTAGAITSGQQVACDELPPISTIASSMDAAPTSGDTGTITYIWYMSKDGADPVALTSPSSNSATLNPANHTDGDGTYVFTRTASFSNSGASCDALPSSGSYTLIMGTPNAEIQEPETNVLCGNNSIQLTLQTDFSSTYSYQWYKDDSPISGATGYRYNVTTPGSYTVQATHRVSGCTDISHTAIEIELDGNTPSVSNDTINSNIEGCSLNDLPAAYTTVAALADGLGITITDDVTDIADMTLTHIADTISSTCPFRVRRTYTIKDECDNDTNVVHNITIENTSTPSIAIATSNNPDGACNPASITAPTFTVTDECATAPTATVNTAGPTGSDCAKTQTWTATYTNACGVSATQQVVTYTWKIDETEPTIGNIAAQDATPMGSCKYQIPDLSSVVLAASTDGCGNVSFVSQSHTAGEEIAQTAVEQSITVTVKVKDECGNEQTKEVTVVIPAKPTATISSTTDINCYNESTGAIDLTVTGGMTDYTYAWSNSVTSEDLSNLPAGTYNVTVTDANGCTATTGATLTQPASALSVNVTGTDVLCFGKSSGEATANVSGGTSDYDYEWSNGEATADISGLAAGNYSVTVTDSKSCTATSSVTITQPETAVNITTINKTNVLCKDADNGTAAVVAEGGTLASGHTYNYIWSNSEATTSISDLAPGTYYVTVSDDNSCTATGSVSITEPDSLKLTTEESNVSCAGSANGSVNVTVSGGTTPYTYAWSGSATSTEEDLQDLSGGTYTLVVTDQNNCTVTTTIEIEEPDVLTLGLSPIKESCNGRDGKITAAATGGTQYDRSGSNPYYLYSWYKKNTSTDSVLIASNVTQLDTLVAGNYTVVVKDANSCEAKSSVSLELNNPLAINSTLSANPTICSGGSFSFAPEDGEDGSIPDGTLYSWEAPVVPNVSNTHAGVNQPTIHDEDIVYTGTESSVDIPYIVTAKFGNICENSTSVNVTVNATLNGNMTISLTNDTVCPNVGTKTLTATLGNLTNAYEITWIFNGDTTKQTRTASETTPTLNVTIPSNNCNVTYPYIVSIEDNLHCKNSMSENVVVKIPTWTISEPNGRDTVACPSAATAPTPPTVTDGCNTELTPVSIGFDPDQDDPVICDGTVVYQYQYTACDGTSKIWTYTYVIDDTINPTLSDCSRLGQELTSDNCTFVVPDFEDEVMALANDNCTIAEYVQSPAADAEITETTVVTVYVKDACGNESEHRTFTLTVPEPVQLAEVSASHVDVLCKNNATGSFTVSASDGKADYTYTWNTTSNATGVFSNLEDGTYTVTVTDANGCTATETVEITEPDAVLTATLPAPTAICYGDSRTLTVTAQGGTTTYNYNWSDGTNPVGENSNSITVNPTTTTTYYVTVTDAHNCTVTDSKALTVNSLPVVSVSNVSDLCPNIGSTELTANITTASASPYKYEWSGMTVTPATTSGATATSNTVTATIPATCGTSYTVTVTLTDNNGCTATDDAAVSVMTPVKPTIALATGVEAVNELNCNPESIPTPTNSDFVVTDECNSSANVSLAAGTEQIDGCSHSKTWTATYTNSCGESADAKTITYTWTIDNTAPTIAGKLDTLKITGCSVADKPAAVTSVDALEDMGVTISDECSGTLTVTSSDAAPTGNCQLKIVRTYTITDECENKSTTKQIITITRDDFDIPDNDGSTVACLANATPPTPPTVEDACNNTIVPDGPDEGGEFNGCSGTKTYTWTYTDCQGHSHDWVYTYTIETPDAPALTGTWPSDSLNLNRCYDGRPEFPTNDSIKNLFTPSCSKTLTVTSEITKDESSDCDWNITRKYTITDGCTSVYDSITYSGSDQTVPTFTRPNDTTLYLSSTCAVDTLAAHLHQPTNVSDNCDAAPTVSYRIANVQHNCGNTYEFDRVWKVVDDCGNESAEQTQHTTVLDTVKPAITGALTNDTVYLASYSCTDFTLPAGLTTVGEAIAHRGDLVITDCNVADETALLLVTLDEYGEGTCNHYFVRTYAVMDACNNSNFFTHKIVVKDTLAPALTGSWPSDQSGLDYCISGVPAGPIKAEIEAQFDDCATFTVDSSRVLTGTDCAWTALYIYTLTDACDNTFKDTVTYSGGDQTAPALTGSWPSNQSGLDHCASAVPAGPTKAEIEAQFDDCATFTVDSSRVLTGTDCAWTALYIYTLTDACGNVFKDTVTYSGGDQTAPALTGSWPSNQSGLDYCISGVPAGPIKAEIEAQFDDCATFTVDSSRVLTGTDCAWTALYIYTLTDACGNVFKDTVTYSGSDQTAPTIVCEANITRNADVDMNYATITLENPTYDDNCSATYVITYSPATPTGADATNASGQYPLGTTTVTYTATDGCGNADTCSFTVDVADNQIPEITCPGTIMVECIDEVPAAYTTYAEFAAAGGSATDNDAIVPSTFTLESEVSDGNDCPETITRTYSIEDNSGLSNNCTQLIIVNDVTAPTFVAPADLTLYKDAICNYNADTSVTHSVPTSLADNCSDLAHLTVSYEDADVTPMDACQGTVVIKRTWKVTDACGNESVAQDQTITVLDDIDPTFTIPADITICRAFDGTISAPTATTGEPTDVADNCDTAPTVSWTDLDTTGTDLETRTIHRQWTVADDCGNETVKVQEIDILPSVIVPGAIDVTCAHDTAVELCYGFADTLLHLDAPTVVNHMTGTTYAVTSDPADGYRFPVGTTTVTWYITDDNACGSSVVCTQYVTITLPPCGTPADSAYIDGYAYSSVRIGYQCWTGENMRHTHYADNSVVDPDGYADYDNDPANDEKFGKLYSWYAAMGLAEGDDATSVAAHAQGICPEGWSMPTAEDYAIMVATSGGVEYTRSPDAQYWVPAHIGILPASGISFLARGAGYWDSETETFNMLYANTLFWTTEASAGSSAPTIELGGVCDSENISFQPKNRQVSVRCIKLCE